MPNLSFETAGLIQGTADQWDVAVRLAAGGIGIFGASSTIWDYAESFERLWFSPFVVHEQADTDNTVVVPDASVGGGWPSVYDLLEAVAASYKQHVLTARHIHRVPDQAYVVYFSRPTTPTEAQFTAIIIKHYLYMAATPLDTLTADWGHLSSWAGGATSWPAHHKADILNYVLTADPGGPVLADVVALSNELKLRLNAHMLLTSYGSSNEASVLYLNDIAHADLPSRQVALFRDLRHESFERDWAVPEMTTSGKIFEWVNPHDHGAGKLFSQRYMVDMDASSTSWPVGHVEFLSSWGLIESQRGPEESFEVGWKLPGSHTRPTNDEFHIRYFDNTTGHWRFNEVEQLQAGIVENFESGWRDCEVGAAKYWSGTEWRFVETPTPPGRQLFVSGMGSQQVPGHEEHGGIDTWGFGSFDIGDPGSSSYAIPLPAYLGYSPDVCVKIISGAGISGAAIVRVNFVNADGASDFCHIALDGTEIAGDYLFQCFTQVASLTAPRYHFWEKWSGMSQVTSISVVSGGTGRFGIRGYFGCIETLEGEDWTLTLTI